MIQEMFYFPVGAVHFFEITHNFTHRVHHREGAGIPADDPGNSGCLGLIHHTQQNIGFLSGIHTLCGNQSCGVMGLFNDSLIEQSISDEELAK